MVSSLSHISFKVDSVMTDSGLKELFPISLSQISLLISLLIGAFRPALFNKFETRITLSDLVLSGSPKMNLFPSTC